MAAWVRCTDSQDRSIFLNLDVATSMSPLMRTGLTRVSFVGAEKDTVEVKETPDYLVGAADKARR